MKLNLYKGERPRLFYQVCLTYIDRLEKLDLSTLNDRRMVITRSFYSSVLDSSNRIHDILPTRSDCTEEPEAPTGYTATKYRPKRFQDSLLPNAIKNCDNLS